MPPSKSSRLRKEVFLLEVRYRRKFDCISLSSFKCSLKSVGISEFLKEPVNVANLVSKQLIVDCVFTYKACLDLFYY